MVHHIMPAEYFTEYSFENWNLISLCNKCHNMLHERDAHQLTATGWKLLEKTAREKNIEVPEGIKKILTGGS